MPLFTKILPGNAIREWDAFTIDKENITSFQLMQRAAYTCYRYLKNVLSREDNVAVLCGPGNNGGDGFLIASYLKQSGFCVDLYHSGEGGSDDREKAKVYAESVFNELKWLKAFNSQSNKVVIDALFGHSLTRELEGDYALLLEEINKVNQVYSIDMPSGMPSEPQPEIFNHHVKDAVVLTFQRPKQCFYLDEYKQHIHRVEVLDIGLHPGFKWNVEVPVLLDEALISSIYQQKARVSHKGTYGSAALVVGSDKYPGAADLAVGACLISGVGKTFVYTPGSVKDKMASNHPEAIWMNETGLEWLNIKPDVFAYSAIGVGPGIGEGPTVDRSLRDLFQQEARWIIDADALNYLARYPDIFLTGEVVITPHPGEFDRLTHQHHSNTERWETAKALAKSKAWIIVLKGSSTAVFYPDGRHYINSTGNAGLAKGGSGDVLCGLITGYAARGYSVDEAVLLGVYLHGLAAEEAAKEKSLDGIVAGELGERISRLTKKWEN